jgi:hypothetical protein
MSNSHGLSDEQVSNELKRMIAFIKQEAVEKSREIHIKVHTTYSYNLLIIGGRGIRHRESEIGSSRDFSNRCTV